MNVTTARSLDLRANTLTPYMRVRLRIDADVLTVAWTESLLGLVPLRRRTSTAEGTVRLRLRLFPSRLLVAVGLLLCLGLIRPVWAVVAVGAVAFALLVLSLVLVMELTDRQGAVRTIPLCVVQRRDIAEFLGIES